MYCNFHVFYFYVLYFYSLDVFAHCAVSVKPCFLQYDQYSVGTILPKEVTFVNLNNNVNQAFLRDMCKGIGNIEDVIIYYHPKSKRHLGIGMVCALIVIIIITTIYMAQ